MNDCAERTLPERQTLLGDSVDDASNILYRPQTQETKQTCKALLGFIQEAIGDQAQTVLCDTADEVLIILKNDKLCDKDNKNVIEILLITKIRKQRFEFLVNLGKKNITDWSTDDKAEKEDKDIDETYAVHVEFEDSDDEDEADGNEVCEDEDDDLSEDEETKMDYIIQGKKILIK